jgi:hypothetical protein
MKKETKKLVCVHGIGYITKKSDCRIKILKNGQEMRTCKHCGATRMAHKSWKL